MNLKEIFIKLRNRTIFKKTVKCFIFLFYILVLGAIVFSINKDYSLYQKTIEKIVQEKASNNTDKVFSSVGGGVKESRQPGWIIQSDKQELVDNWGVYVNEEHGFAVNIPKKLGYGGCEAVEQEGKMMYKYKEGFEKIPLKVLEAGNSFYIYNEYKYQLFDEKGGKSNNDDKYHFDCRKVFATPEQVREESDGFGDYFVVEKVKNDKELENFIKDNYGTSCRLGDKIEGDKRYNATQDGVLEIRIESDGNKYENSKCLLNFAYTIFYSPQHQKAMSWKLGQAVNFIGPDDVSYDSAMVNSFKFF